MNEAQKVQYIKEVDNWHKWINKLEIEAIVRTDLGVAGFEQIRDELVVSKELINQLEISLLSNVPNLLIGELYMTYRDFHQILEKAHNYNPNDKTGSGQRDRVLADFPSKKENFIIALLPVLEFLDRINVKSSDESEYKKLLSELKIAKTEGDTALNQIQQALENVRETAAETGVGKFSVVFYNEHLEHKKSARIWLGFVVTCIILIMIAATFFIFSYPGTEELEVFHFTTTKIVILSVLFFALSFCNRNYKIKQHNAVLNKHRSNALTTFEIFVKAGEKDQDVQHAVLLEVTKTIFSNQSTGYLKSSQDGDNSSSIIEIIKSTRGSD